MSSSANPGAGAAPVAKNLQPASYASRYVEAAGLKLHYLDYGTPGRPPMLCVHGGAAHAHWFDFVAPSLSADYHVRALDLRGHGDSQAAEPPSYRYQDYASDLAAAIEKLDLRDFVLVGHSMGGMVSLVYAAGYPGRVSRLIVADSTMHMGEDRVATLRDVGTRQGSVYATQEELVARYRLRPSGTLATPETVRYVAAHSSRQSADGTWRHKLDRNVYARRENIDGMPYWDKIRIPALIVKGDHSPRISPEIFAEVKARCPQVELAEVPQSDHHVTLDNPPGFVDAVRPFLSRHG
jgi:pimeloyl-ACP methyl ester carboxylesterase